MKEQSKELFFVQIKEPTAIRRDIFGILKEIVEALKKFENFKHMRHEKLEKINQLRVLLKQTNKMLGNLRLKLPQTSLRANAIKEVPSAAKKHGKKAKKGKGRAEKPEAPQKREMTEIEKLESELSAIESKLKSLS